MNKICESKSNNCCIEELNGMPSSSDNVNVKTGYTAVARVSGGFRQVNLALNTSERNS